MLIQVTQDNAQAPLFFGIGIGASRGKEVENVESKEC